MEPSRDPLRPDRPAPSAAPVPAGAEWDRPDDHAPDDEPTLEIVLYSCLTDTTARRATISWPELPDDLLEHTERASKGGPLWSPVTLIPGSMIRKNENVAAVTALVFDFDHREPQWGLLEGLDYFAYTTWAHHADDAGCTRPDCPHWRVAILLARPVPRPAWPAFWERARFWLAPDADESCRDESRAYYPPICKPAAPRRTRRGQGVPLDPDSLRPVPPDPKSFGPIRAPATDGSTDGERPGDRFARETDWAEILGPPGWRLVATVGDGSRRWRCPNSSKRVGHCATTGGGGYDVLYVFCDAEGTPFRPRTSYTKFRAHSLLEHGGDDTAAAGALAERYGMHERRNGRSHAVGAAPGSNGARPRSFTRTETGNAERLIRRHGDDLRYCHAWGAWVVYDGRRWKRDATGEPMRRVKESVRSMYPEAAAIDNDDERKAAVSWAKHSEAAKVRANTLKLAESEPGVPLLPEQVDADPFLLNVLNGTVDLRTGQLHPHRREDLLTKLAPVAFHPDAECPAFLAFLERVVPDETVRRFLQRAIGYSLTGDTSEQCLCFLHGRGANGKSTLLAILQEILGDYARQAAPELLTHKSRDRHPTELADLFGARLVTSVEVDEGKRLAETLVKQMTGGDWMKARFMRGDFFEWTPTHKLFLAANHRPVIRGTDYAIWRRIHLVPFEVTIPKEERDPQLPTKLLAEASGILAWAVRGCLEWQRGGLGVPKVVEDATAAYRAEQDVLADFLTECCILDPQASVTSKQLYKAYGEWCEQGGERPISKTAFGIRLTERGFTQDRCGKDRARSWLGLRLRGLDEPFGGRVLEADAFGRDFPDNLADPLHERHTPEHVSNASAGPNASAADDRDTACWRCKRPLSTASEYPCEACGWLRCDCGACSEYCADHIEEDL